MTGPGGKHISILQCIAASLPLLLTTVVFAWPLFFEDSYLLGTDLRTLAGVMQIEWLLMAGGMFLVLPLVANSMHSNWRVCLVVFVAFAWIFAYGAYDLGGIRGLAAYVLLLFLSYGRNTFFVRKEYLREIAGPLAAARWVIALFPFFLLVVYLDLGKGNIKNWAHKPAAVELGAWFFFILFLLELFVFSWVTQLVYNYASARQKREIELNGLMQARQRYYDTVKRGARSSDEGG